MSKTTKDMVSAMYSAIEKKTTPYDTRAEVRRIEGDTAWVHIPGGIDETPAKLTIDAKPGDTVQVRVSAGTAFLVGNSTAPPTDDTVAKSAANAAKANAQRIDEVAEVADDAFGIAGNTNQYFWHVETGTDTGAHITEIPRSDFLADPEHGGGNLLARSNGIAVRNGLTELAQFSADGERFLNEQNASLFEVGRKADGLYAGDVEWFAFDNTQADYPAEWTINSVTSVRGCDVTGDTVYTVSSANYSFDGNVLTIDATGLSGLDAANAALIRLSYSALGRFPYYTLGNRRKEYAAGNYSTVIGENCVASGATSLAQGESTRAVGANSIATGQDSRATNTNAAAFGQGTEASGANQLVVGKYNTIQNPEHRLFVVGKGTSASSPSDAFAVESDGTLDIGNPSDTFFEEKYTVMSSQTVTAGGYASGTETLTKAGYYPMSVSGWNASTRYLTLTRAHLHTRASGSGKLDWMVYNPDGSSRTGNLTIYVIWVKMT